jgi:signal transduction histidine kinase
LLFPPDRTDEFPKTLEQLQAGRMIQDYETVRLHKDGTPIEMAVNVSRITNGAGELNGLCKVIRDIRERKQLEHEVAEQADRERQFLAQELHDSVGQLLTGLGMMASTLHGKLKGADASLLSLAARLEETTDQIKQQIRSLAKGLLPLGEKGDGLVQALTDLVQQTENTFDMPCRFEHDLDLPAIAPFASSHLYRIAQEAVHNAVKHARAQQITLRLHGRRRLALTIEDDGVGLPARRNPSQGLGLKTMHYRAGLIGATFQVQSAPGQGTKITCALPSLQERSDG